MLLQHLGRGSLVQLEESARSYVRERKFGGSNHLDISFSNPRDAGVVILRLLLLSLAGLRE